MLPSSPVPNRVPDFTPHRRHEHQRDGLDSWSEENWSKVDPDIRARVEAEVRLRAPEEMLATWRDQRARGISIGSDDPRFHFGVGMQVRNACRLKLVDAELPVVTVDSDGKPYGPSQNWDDYYFGVLAAIAA